MKKPKDKNSKSYKKWRERVDYKNGLKSWSKLVRERDGNKCVVCGSDKNLNVHHILDKRFYKEHSLNVDVGVSLCVLHHKYSKLSAHTNVLWFSLWLEENRAEQYKKCVEIISLDKLQKNLEEFLDKGI